MSTASMCSHQRASWVEQRHDFVARHGDEHPFGFDGHLVAQYPQYEGKRVRIQLDCASIPGDGEIPFFTGMHDFAAGEDIEFGVNGIASESQQGAAAT